MKLRYLGALQDVCHGKTLAEVEQAMLKAPLPEGVAWESVGGHTSAWRLVLDDAVRRRAHLLIQSRSASPLILLVPRMFIVPASCHHTFGEEEVQPT